MRLGFLLCGVMTLAPAFLLTGCGANVNQASTAVTGNQEAPGISGKTFGGEQPVAGATVEVVAMGTSGYGSPGSVLASTTTDAGGYFSFAQSAYTCPQPDTPVYILSIGGDDGSGINPNVVLGAGLGPCTNAKSAYVKINEVTTVALAYSLAHFFSPTFGGSSGANDWFGGPSTTSNGTIQYSKGLVMGNSHTIPTLVDNAQGLPVTGASYTSEWQKILTIANVLQKCVESAGGTATGTPCGDLFNFTTIGASTPSDTLQAAVMMALHPTTQVANIYNLSTTTPAFPGGLTSAPHDWSIGVSYPSPSFGLGVDTGTTSTLDIDSSGRIWFPSNAAGHPGVGYFDPANQSFNGPFNTTVMQHPQQVAIDANGYAWLNDSGAAIVPAYLTTNPATTQTKTLPGAFSNALTVRGDDTVSVGVSVGGTPEMANIAPDRSTYSVVPGITFTYPQTSMAGDDTNGVAVGVTNTTSPTLQDFYVTPAPASTNILSATDFSGQVAYTGNDRVGVESYAGAGGATDGLCIYSKAACYPFTVNGAGIFAAAEGLAVDGAGQLWIAASGGGSVLQAPINNSAASNGGVYLNPSTGTDVPVNQLLHGTGVVGGGTATAPVGVGVDAEGNVWMTNANCIGTGCKPSGNFTLTEIIGAAFPTITPVSAQITSGNLAGKEPTQ